MTGPALARNEQIRDALRRRRGRSAWTDHQPPANTAPVPVPETLRDSMLRNADTGMRGAVVCVVEDGLLARISPRRSTCRAALAEARDWVAFEGVGCYVVDRDTHGVRILDHTGTVIYAP